MKTFDEAVATIMPTVKSPNTDLEEKLTQIVTAFTNEALNNPTVMKSIFVVCTDVGSGNLGPMDALLTMFLNGVAIGRELEKVE